MWGGKKVEADAPVSTEPAQQGPDIKMFANGLPLDVGEIPDGLANITAQGCNACHFQAHDDWAISGHAHAGKSEVFREAIARAAGSTACTQCHLPLKVQHAQLAAGFIDGDLARPHLKPNPAFNATLMAEGVGCAACHIRDGQVVSTRAVTGAPHPVSKSTELGKSEVCATCHQLSYPDADKPFYDTFGEWSATPHAAAGIQCQDCHMPPRAELATASRFVASPDHRFEANLARALTVLVEMPTNQIQRGTPMSVEVRLQNTGAGHHVPTGSPYKKLKIEVQLRDANDKVISNTGTSVLGRTVSATPPYTTESDNRINAGGEHEINTEFLVSHKTSAGPISLIVQATQGQETPVVLTSIPLELN